jgi:two-component system, OmpR family, sensor histidine kinase QseC
VSAPPPATRPVRSLQTRLLVWTLGLLAAAWLATGLATWLGAQHELDELLDSHLAQAAALLVVQQANGYVSDGDGDGDDGQAGVDVPVLHRYAPRVAFQVWHEGVLTTRSPNAPAVPMGAGGRHAPEGFATLQLGDEDWRVFSTRGLESDVQVYVGEQLLSRQDILQAVLEGLLWPAVVALPVLVAGLWWAVRKAMAPMRSLGTTLALRRPQDLHPVQAPAAPAEMQPMLAALNGLLARIAELMEAERRFTADAAHELRTPIAAIRAQAQVALAAAADEPTRRHALQATLSGCDRATRLVEQLLTLSRLEGSSLPTRTEVDLGALARQVLADQVPAALLKDQTLSLEIEPSAEGARVPGSETLLGLMLRNLVDNAVRYSPRQAQVQVSLRQDPTGALELRVDDSGPGLAEAEQARLGERFFRVLGSGETGSGLGWSIVQRVAAAQQVAVQVARSATLGGLSVALRWPAVAPPPEA